MIIRHLLSVLAGIIVSCVSSLAGTSIHDLRIQHSDRPLSIEDRHPMFSWRMESDKRGQRQTAYKITVVRESDGSVLWDTGKVKSDQSVDIPYQGVSLQAEHGYGVNLTVWDVDGKEYQAYSRFETGIMNPRESAWNGAEWIGTTKYRLDALAEPLFEIETDFSLLKGDVASLILGADDIRLENAFLNDYGTQSKENYIQVDVDFGKKELRVFRVGYYKEDKADRPVITINESVFPKGNLGEVFSARGKEAKHTFKIRVEVSKLIFTLDGKEVSNGLEEPFSINKMGADGNRVSFPNLNSVGFAAEPGQKVEYSGYRIMNSGQSEDTVVLDSKRGPGYSIFKGKPGVEIDGERIIVSNSSDRNIRFWSDPSYGSETMLRSEFTLRDKPIRKARLYASAMGVYRLFLNGGRVGEDWFAPGDSQYREVIGYQAYDVTSMVKAGRNAIGAELASGWYTSYQTFSADNFNFFGDHEALLSRLVVTYTDGSKDIFVSNKENWKVFKDGPVRGGSFFQGEHYDASKEVKGWSEPGFDDSAWLPAEQIAKRDWIDFDIVARYDELVRIREVLIAKEIMPVHSSDSHTYIYNMGVNMAGVPSVTIPAGWLKKGDRVTLAYGEQVYPGLKGDDKKLVNLYGKKGRGVAGHILFQTNRAALDLDVYIANGSEEVTIQPSTTYRGYQYIQVTLPSHEGPLPLENVKGLVLSSCPMPTGKYNATTSDKRTGELVNQLFKNIQRGQLGNFYTIPTDCPQRNERMGWTGDAQAYTRTGTYNANTQNFYRQWMVSLRADQGVGSDTDVAGGIGSLSPDFNKKDVTEFLCGTTWSAAVCQVPWQVYTQYGDKQIVEDNIETMMDWLNGMAFYPMNDKYPYLSFQTGGLADWLSIDERTPNDLVNNAIYIYMMEATANMAEAIGRNDYAATLRERHEKAKADWNSAYVDPVTGKTRSLDGKIVDSQASYATPLNFNCFSDENKARAEARLADIVAHPEDKSQKPWTITTGFSGTTNILPALSRGGYSEEAFRMISCTDFASWLYPVTEGATSIWERWSSYDSAFLQPEVNGMNSFNHYALGAVGQWMYEFQLGITTDHGNGAAGYKNFVLQPTVGGDYTSLEGSYTSNYGKIESAWTAEKGRMTSYRCTVPANTNATVYLPVGDDIKIAEECDGVVFKGFVTRNCLRTACYEVTSGNHVFTIGDKVTASY